MASLSALATFFGLIIGTPWKSDGPIEIDLSPLPSVGDNVKYELHLTLLSAEGGLEQGYNVGLNNAPSDVAELVLESLPKGFQAKADGAKLVVTSFNGKPITKVEVVTDGLPKGANPPKVRRLPKP